MKILTKEEEDEHYSHVLKGGLAGGALGVSAGLGAAYLLHHRYPFFRNLTLPFKAFFVTSTGTFASIISADRSSRGYQNALHHPGGDYMDRTALAQAEARATRTPYEKMMQFGKENRYSIVGVSWLASMGISLSLVARDKYLSRSQKIVQARVYAQGLTLLVLIASAAFEVSDSKDPRNNNKDTVRVLDPNDPEHKRMIEKKIHHETYKGEDLWMDMVESEEKKIKAKEEAREKEKKRLEEENKKKERSQ